MAKTINILYLFSVLLISCTQSNNNYKNSKNIRSTQTLILQPINYTSIVFQEDIRKEISAHYGFKVIVGNDLDVPHSFINLEKGFRYSADSLLVFLQQTKPDSCIISIGYTNTDIFISKREKDGTIKLPENKYKVWGIFGLARKPGVSSIVSVKRLYTKNLVKYKARVLKVILHEIGHNLGLKHCPDKKCFMTDAVESIKTVDNASLSLCNKCSNLIGN